MKQKALDLLNKAKELGSKHPFLAGLAVGYMGHPLIELSIHVGANLIKIFLG